MTTRAHPGSALLSALMVLAVLVGLVAALAPMVRVDVRAAGRDGEALRAQYLARAGVQMARVILQQDEADVDGLEDEWALLGERGRLEYPLGEGHFRLEVIDASSRIDLNRADRETLLRLPGIDEQTVEEILAWRGDEDAAASSAANYEGGLEPYRLKARPFDTVEELLLVQGVTPLLFYGARDVIQTQEQAPWSDLLFVDTGTLNQDAAGQARVDLNGATADQLIQASGGSLSETQARSIVQRRTRTGPFESLADLLTVPGLDPAAARGLVDHVTLEPGEGMTGLLNLNTASVAALETIPDVTSEMAEQIVSRRETEGAFQSVGDLLDMGEEEFRALVDHASTRSAVFIVRVWGETDSGVGRAVEAWVRREGGSARVVRWRDVPRTPGWEMWRWDEEGTVGETVGVGEPGA